MPQHGCAGLGVYNSPLPQHKVAYTAVCNPRDSQVLLKLGKPWVGSGGQLQEIPAKNPSEHPKVNPVPYGSCIRTILCSSVLLWLNWLS